MTITSRKWFLIWLALATCFLCSVAGFVFFVNPYGYYSLWGEESTAVVDNTMHPVRFKADSLQRGDYRSLLLGTSRVGFMDPNVVAQLVGKGKTFNLSQPGSSIEIHYDFLNYALRFNDIKTVIYGVDFSSFRERISISPVNAEYYELKEDLKTKRKINNYDSLISYQSLKDAVKGALFLSAKNYNFYAINGQLNYGNCTDQLLDMNFSKSLSAFFGAGGIYENFALDEKYFNYLARIVETCHQKKINLYVYIPPMSFDHFNGIKESYLFGHYIEFLKKIAEIVNYVDFNYDNYLTRNRYNFCDSSHLRTSLTREIMGNLFKNYSGSDSKIGYYISRNTIDSYLKDMAQ